MSRTGYLANCIVITRSSWDSLEVGPDGCFLLRRVSFGNDPGLSPKLSERVDPFPITEAKFALLVMTGSPIATNQDSLYLPGLEFRTSGDIRRCHRKKTEDVWGPMSLHLERRGSSPAELASELRDMHS